MLYGYARVSREKQSLDRQLDALVAYGVKMKDIFQEKITGTKRHREELDKLMEKLQPGDLVVIADLFRLGRSTKDLFDIVEQIQAKGADIKSLKEDWLDTTTPQGKFMFTVFAGLSQFERDLTSERTKEGLQAARNRGRFGGRPSTPLKKREDVLHLHFGGLTIRPIAEKAKLSPATVCRIINTSKIPKMSGTTGNFC